MGKLAQSLLPSNKSTSKIYHPGSGVSERTLPRNTEHVETSILSASSRVNLSLAKSPLEKSFSAGFPTRGRNKLAISMFKLWRIHSQTWRLRLRVRVGILSAQRLRLFIAYHDDLKLESAYDVYFFVFFVAWTKKITPTENANDVIKGKEFWQSTNYD